MMIKEKAFRACPCCGNHEVEPQLDWVFDSKCLTLRLGRCLDCDMVYVTNSDEVDMTNSRYVDWQPDTDDDPVTPPMLVHNQGILNLASKYLPVDAEILDYGAGYCGFLRVAKVAGYKVEGINPCKYLADWAGRKLDIRVHATFGQDFETKSQFDLVVSDQTFEHLVEPTKDLGKIYSLLKKGGIAYINVPNFTAFGRYIHGIDYLKDISHYNYFTLKTLANLCAKEKFKVICIAPTISSGLAKRMIKYGLDRLGLGDCSVLLQKM